MIKRLMIKRLFNLTLVFLAVFMVSLSFYFYSSAITNKNALESSLSLIYSIIDKNIANSIYSGIYDFYWLAILQTITFFVSVVSLIFLLWFIFRLYSIEKNNALTDSLTELYNRRAILFGLKHELEMADRFNHPVSLAIIDIDYFKRFNDLYGHSAGDRVLVAISKFLKKNIRDVDLAGRFGGEEFIIVFPETGIKKAWKVCEKLRLAVEHGHFEDAEKLPPEKITISIGLGGFDKSAVNKTKRESELIEYADKQLYTAKLAGRNCIR